MDISEKEAQDSLEQIQAVSIRTRKTIAASYDSAMLMMWGLIWFVAFLGTHFFLGWVWPIWMGLSGIGCIATLVFSWSQSRSANPVKIPAAEKIGWRIFWFWSLLFVYIFLWLSILKPLHGIQINAFICTTIMFAYIVTGLWFKCYYMVWLGLGVTCTTLVGFYLIPPSYYCLWMAPTGGGSILGTGLYIRLFWK
ncbi:MAG: hypothetical protein FVQ85_10130 [Planctomycetes bacterium]|nr:hypothetical protein [Planctomycetota bacterium]